MSLTLVYAWKGAPLNSVLALHPASVVETRVKPEATILTIALSLVRFPRYLSVADDSPF